MELWKMKKKRLNFSNPAFLVPITPILHYSNSPAFEKCGGESDGKKDREGQQEEKSRKETIA
jgi:hypothetical protein